jgi:hypothetical protein
METQGHARTLHKTCSIPKQRVCVAEVRNPKQAASSCGMFFKVFLKRECDASQSRSLLSMKTPFVFPGY